MKRTLYRVEMHTPLGIRTGQLLLVKDGEVVEGWFEVLSKRESIHGIWISDDACKFCGQMNSLIRNIPFSALCHVISDRVEIKLLTEDDEFIVYGREI